ncbi:MAG: GldG family protein [Terrimicrobiaceae bacterium]|nr:GldG family protein [Terrimicrobiaceae bacterium]
MAIIFVVLNVFSFQHYFRADFSRSQKFALAQQTKRVLKELKKPVDIVVIASPSFASPVTQIFRDVKSLLDEFEFSGRERIRVEYVDPTRDLTRMRELQGRFKFNAADSLLILDYDGRSRMVPMSDMADFDFRPVARGEQPILLAFRGEQVLTGALISLLRPENQTVYFLQGHGGPDFSKLTLFAEYLQKQNLEVRGLSLASTDIIPEDAGALIIVGPRFDLEERELAVLRAWWQKRGRLLVLLDPESDTPRLRSLLEAAGIAPRNDRVLRTIRLPFATGILRDVTAFVLPTTEWTRRLTGAAILLTGATQSLALNEPLAAKEQIQLRALLEPAEEFWGEVDYAPNNPDGVRYQDGTDHGQPLVVAAAADRGGLEDDRVEVETSRVIVVGSSQFALDADVKPQGLDFLLGAVNSLLDRSRISGVAPKAVSHFSLNLTERQLGWIAFFSMLVIPGVAAMAGLFVWWRRRS